MKHTVATKRKLSAMRRGKLNPFYGKTHTPEFIAAAKARQTGRSRGGAYIPSAQKITVPSGQTLAYLAGMIDADGSIRFRKCNPFIAIYNTNMPLIKWIVKTLGHGSLCKAGKGRKQVMAWSIQGARDVYAFSLALRPLLIVKRADADKAIKHLSEKYSWQQ